MNDKKFAWYVAHKTVVMDRRAEYLLAVNRALKAIAPPPAIIPNAHSSKSRRKAGRSHNARNAENSAKPNACTQSVSAPPQKKRRKTNERISNSCLLNVRPMFGLMEFRLLTIERYPFACYLNSQTLHPYPPDASERTERRTEEAYG